MKSALVVGMIVIGGVGAGLVVERAGLVSPISETSIVATLDEVPYYGCPEQSFGGNLHRGDRVFATGKTETGDWVEIRAPFDLASRVWVEARWLNPDSGLEVLPEADCEGLEFEVAAATTTTITAPSSSATSSTTTTITPPSSAATTTTAVATTTTAVATTTTAAATTTTAAATTTTAAAITTTAATTTTTSTTTTTTSTTAPPADQEGPTVILFQSTEDELWEDANYGGCPSQQRTAVVSAAVFDPSGISSVQLSWSVGSSSGIVEMLESASDIYSVTIGLFPANTISGADAPILLTLTARDTLFNPTAVSSGTRIPPLLHDCVIG